MHAEDDLMGDENSWRTSLKTWFFCRGMSAIAEYGDGEYPMGLAYYSDIITFL